MLVERLPKRNLGNLLPTFMQIESKLKGHFGKITGLAFSEVLNVLVSSGADAQASIFFPFYIKYHYSFSQARIWHFTLSFL